MNNVPSKINFIKMKYSKHRVLFTILFVLLILLIIFGVLVATKIVCFHNVKEATCTEPKYCINCGKIFEEQLGHLCENWKKTKEPTCSCEGEEVCKCERCNEMITRAIEKLPHTEGQWVISTPIMVRNDGSVRDGEKSLKCSVCGQTIRTEIYSVNVTESQKNALKEAISSLEFWHPSYSYLQVDILEKLKGYSNEDAIFAADNCGADWNEQAMLNAKKQTWSGASRDRIISELQRYRFTQEQIDYALIKIGY